MMEQTWQKLSLELKQYSLKGSNSAVASCPAHEDQTPSLSLERKKDIILVKCHAGCGFKEIIEALKMTQKEFKAQKKAKPIKKEVCRYTYHDEQGETLGQVVRFTPKSFLRARKVDGKDVWNWKGIKLVPYKLPELIDSVNKDNPIIMVEGEKDADNLISIGYSATTLPGGAGKWRSNYKQHFLNSDLILIPDNDKAGISGMEKVAEALIPIAKRIRILQLNNLKSKEDVSDWLKKNHFNKDLLDQLIEKSTSSWSSSKRPTKKTEKTEIDELNDEYAVLTLGNKVVILWERNDEQRFLPVQDFRIRLKNKIIHQQKASEYFLEHPKRREYTKIDMLPGVDASSDVLNLFKGFPIQAKGGIPEIPLFHELILDVICSGNEKWADYFWGWLAHMLQKPMEKPGVAIALLSKAQGVGKSRFVEYIGSLLGQHFVTVTHGRHLHGYFNAHLQKALLVFADEAVWGGDREAESKLKEMITEPFGILEMKHKDAQTQIRSCMRIILATNSDWAAKVSLSDRRYFVLEPSEIHQNDFDFFKQLEHEKNNGGKEALMGTLLEYDLKNFEVRDFPDTPARQNQKIESLEPFEAWWIQLLSEDEPEINGIKLKVDEENTITKKEMRDEFDFYCRNNNPRHRTWSTQKFGRYVYRLFPKVQEIRPYNMERHYRFPALDECRKYIFDKYGIEFKTNLVD